MAAQSPNPLRSRREFLRLAGLAGLGALAAPSLLAACATGPVTTSPAAGAAANALGRPLRIGYLPITDAAPLLLAHARGLYEEEGLEVERPTLFRGWSPLAEAFQAGQVDIVHLLMPMAVWLRFASDVPLKVVAWDHTGGSALTVAPQIDTVEDLAGTTVAVPFWYSIHNAVLQLLLREAGLVARTSGEASTADRSVKLVVMAPPDMPTALSNGSISGYIVADPFNAVAELQGIGKVLRFTGDVWLNHACCVVTASESLVEEAPEVVQSVINAVAGAQLFANEERSEAARLLSADGEGYLPQPLAAVDRALTHYDHAEYGPSGAIRHTDWQTGRIDFQPFPFASYTEELIRLLAETRVEGDSSFLAALDPAEAHRALVDDRFARGAIDKLGGPRTFGLPASLTRGERIEP
jgi:NitT/TauT family transport system substrate-binding protein